MSFVRQNAAAAYGRMASSDTDPLQQIVLLYNGAIKFLNLAAADIEAKDIAAKAEHSGRAMDIIGYLQSILSYENGGEVTPVLDTLYANILMMTLRASAELDAAAMRQAASLLEPVRDAWAANARSQAAQSVSTLSTNGFTETATRQQSVAAV
jgi:flagellar protein FliS